MTVSVMAWLKAELRILLHAFGDLNSDRIHWRHHLRDKL